eukprot:6192269-Pleurochrysis_carterae.AAC.6
MHTVACSHLRRRRRLAQGRPTHLPPRTWPARTGPWPAFRVASAAAAPRHARPRATGRRPAAWAVRLAAAAA